MPRSSPRPTPEPAPKRKPKPAGRASANPIALDGSLWLQHGGLPLGGADRVALLEAIRDTGSMTRAARAVGISYKTAWDRVQGMNNGAGRALVERTAGGVGGGGTVLTPYALELIAAFRELEQTHNQMLGRLSKSMAQPSEVLRSLATLGLRTSARNQLAGTVAEVHSGAVLCGLGSVAWLSKLSPKSPSLNCSRTRLRLRSRLLVVASSPPNSSFSVAPESSSTPQPPHRNAICALDKVFHLF